MKTSLLAAAALAASLAVAQHATAGANSNFQIDATHSGQIRFKKQFQAPLTQLWVTDVGGLVTYPVYGNRLVFVTATNDSSTQLYALKAKTGAVAWHVQVAGGGAPMYENGRVFILGSGGLLQAFNARTGKHLWQTQAHEEVDYIYPGTAAGGLIYFTGNELGLRLYAVRETDGAMIWIQNGAGGFSVPGFADGQLYVTYVCNDFAYGPSNGLLLWAYQLGCDDGSTPGGGTPVYFQNRLYVDDTASQVVLDATTGKKVRDFVIEDFVPAFWVPVSGKPMGFVVDKTGTLTGFDAATGSAAWSVTPKTFWVPPLVINDTVFIGDVNGNLYAYATTTGDLIWSQNLGMRIGNDNPLISGLGAAANMLFVPVGNTISAWVPQK